MIQDTFTSQLVAELLDWRVLFGVLALYHGVMCIMLMVISENLYIILNPWRFQQDAESWMVLKRPTNFYFPQEPVSRAARIRRDNTHPRTHR